MARRATDSCPAHLGIHDNGNCLLGISSLVDDDMAKPFEMTDHGNARILLHALDQAAPTARDDHVHIAFEAGQHVAYCGAVGGHDQLHRVFR